MEKTHRIDSRIKASRLKIPKLIRAVPFKLPFHGHTKQTNTLAQHQGECERNGNIFIGPRATSEAGIK